jgi:hypothetical protein
LDPVTVKPLVDYLQPFIVEKPSSAKASFMRLGFAPFSSRDSQSKWKETYQATSDRVADKSASHTSSNSHKPENSDDHIDNRTGSCTNAPPATPAVVSSVPTHIEHPVTTSTTIAEISVCSLDESLSVSKLSIQSSSVPLGMTIPQGPQNENSMPASSLTSTRHRLDHSQKQQQIQYQNDHPQGSSAPMNKPQSIQDSRFSVDNHTHTEPHSSTTSISQERTNVPATSDSWERICNEYYRQYHSKSVITEPHSATSICHQRTNNDPTKLDSWERICNEHSRQYHPQLVVKANYYIPSTQTPSPAMTDAQCDNTSKKKRFGVQTNAFNSAHKLRGATKIIRTVFGQDQKTHAHWCASEYVV